MVATLQLFLLFSCFETVLSSGTQAGWGLNMHYVTQAGHQEHIFLDELRRQVCIPVPGSSILSSESMFVF